VALKVFDLLGREVKTLMDDELLAAEEHKVRWDGRNNLGQPLSSGVYLYRFDTSEFGAEKKMVDVK